MENETPQPTNEAAGGASDVERVVRQLEYLEWAQRETDRQRRMVHEAEVKQAQFENAICIAVQQAAAVNLHLVLGMFYAALKDA